MMQRAYLLISKEDLENARRKLKLFVHNRTIKHCYQIISDIENRVQYNGFYLARPREVAYIKQLFEGNELKIHGYVVIVGSQIYEATPEESQLLEKKLLEDIISVKQTAVFEKKI